MLGHFVPHHKKKQKKTMGSAHFKLLKVFQCRRALSMFLFFALYRFAVFLLRRFWID